jgi:hypothetical protein
MKHLAFLRPDTLIGLLNFIGLPVAALYVICMFVWPWMSGYGNWEHVQNVWDRWQSLNVGMLAFISSITAFNISKYNAEKQREREFLAAKAFLPAAFSELTSYFRASAELFNAAWRASATYIPNLTAPEPPQEYKPVFGDCIRHAEPHVGDYLSRILVDLQIHDARMRSHVEQYRGNTLSTLDRRNLISLIYRLGELQALVNKIFDFARNMEPFDSSPLKWDDFRSAYLGLNIRVEQISINNEMNLEAFTQRAISRNSSQGT